MKERDEMREEEEGGARGGKCKIHEVTPFENE